MFTLLSQKSDDDITALRASHPKVAKVELAREIVARFHGKAAAEQAAADFERLFPGKNAGDKKGTIPEDAPAFTLQGGKPVAVVDALAETQLMESKSKARALIGQGGLLVNGEKVNDLKFELVLGTHAVRAGKTRWARITVC